MLSSRDENEDEDEDENKNPKVDAEAIQILPSEICVNDTKVLIDSDTKLILIDCREPREHAIANIESSILIPMDEIAERVDELEAYCNDRIVVFCHHGGRSLRVVNWLRNHGYDKAQNMTGGIDFWSQEIDPNVPRY